MRDLAEVDRDRARVGTEVGRVRAAESVGQTGMQRRRHDARSQNDLESRPRHRLVTIAIGVGTGFIGLTDRRVILQDTSFVGKKVAITSIPYSRITSVSVVSNKSWAGSFFSTGSIAIHVGPRTYEVDFRGTEKSQYVHNLILHYIT